jgi:hypothetical protein
VFVFADNRGDAKAVQSSTISALWIAINVAGDLSTFS